MEKDQALKFMYDLLRLMAQKRGSDLFITAGFPPAIKVDGKITPQSNQNLTPQHTAELARAIMNDKQASEFESTKECNFAISPAGIGRFRVNAFVQQARIGVVLRTIATTIPTIVSAVRSLWRNALRRIRKGTNKMQLPACRVSRRARLSRGG